MIAYTSRGARRGIRLLPFGWWVLGFLWSTCVAAQDPDPCFRQDDTAALQALVNANPITVLEGRLYCVNGNGVTLPSDRTLLGNGATLQLRRNCSLSVCKILQTAPAARRIRIFDLILQGEPTYSSSFQVLLRIDQAEDILVDHVTLRAARSDGIQVTGNTLPTGNIPSRKVVLSYITSEWSGRNGGSATNVDGLEIRDSVFQDVSGAPVGPGAAFDFEPNAGGIVRNVLVLRSTFRRSKVGIYVQRGTGEPGDNYVFLDNVIEDTSQASFVLNCISQGLLFRNTLVQSPLGLSIGGFDPPRPCRAYDIVTLRTAFVGTTSPFRLDRKSVV